jgi:hypothetical protein
MQTCTHKLRWAEAKRAGKAPKVMLASTHIKALDFVSLSDLVAHAADKEEAEAEAVAAKQGGSSSSECAGEDGSSGGPTVF